MIAGREIIRGGYLLAGFGFVALLMLALPVDRGQARESHTSGLRIASPASGALVTARTVRLEVRGAGKRAVKVFNGPRRLKVRVSEPRRGVRIARLRRKRDLHRGTNVISIRAGHGFDQRAIVLGRKRGGLLAVSKALRRSGRGGPVRARTRVAASVDSFQVRLNGRRVEEAFEPIGAKLRSAALNAGHGIRFGRNRMVVTGWREDGRFDREVRHFRVSRSHPLAGAGRDRSSRAGRPLRLDGRSSKPTRRGSPLRYRWQVVSGPRHKRVRLRGARSARPRLIANHAGRYRIRLTVRQRAPSRSGSRSNRKPEGKRSATLAQGSRPRGGLVRAASATDTTTVTVAPSLPPIGAPVRISPGEDKLTIDGKDYPRPAGQGSGPQLLVLDRKTLAEDTRATQGYDFDSGGWESLADTLANLEKSGPENLVVLSGGGRDAACDSDCRPLVEKLLEAVGGTWSEHRDVQSDLGSGEWSLVGVPGSSSGSATQSIGGGLDGYLQPDNNQNFKFVFGDYVPIDTSSVPGLAAGRNLITVGDKTYPSQSDDYRPGEAGFQVLALFQDDLTPHSDETYWTNSSATAVNPAEVDRMAADLEVLSAVGTETPLLVIIQSIGAPNPGGENWQSWAKSLPSAIAELGGTAAVIRTLNLGQAQSGHTANHLGDRPGGYSLVGGTDLRGFGTEQTYWYTGQPARINGMLSRNNQSQYEVDHAGPVSTSSSPDDDLSRVAYRAPTPWPVTGTAAERAANSYITHRLGFPQDDLRVAYYEEDTVAWQSKWDLLSGLSYPGGSPGFAKADFATVKKQLLSEIAMVEQVRAMIAAYQRKLFGSTSEDSALVDLQSVSHQIEQAVSVKGNEGVSSAAEAEEITGLLLGVAAEVGGLAGPEVAIGLSAASAAFEIAGTVSDDEDGNPLPGEVSAKADQLGIELADRYGTISNALDHVGDLLVSDYGKLRIADERAAGAWGLSSVGIETAQNGLKASSQRWIYGALMPVAYQVYGLGWSWNSGTRVTDPYYYRCYSRKYEGSLITDWELHNRFEDADWSTYYLSRSDSGIWYPQILSTEIDFYDDSQRHYLSPNNSNSTPPTWLTQRLFGSPLQGDGKLGLNQPTFFARSGFNHTTMDCYDKR